MDRNSKIAKNVPKMFQDSRCLTETPRFLDELEKKPIDRNSKISEIPKIPKAPIFPLVALPRPPTVARAVFNDCAVFSLENIRFRACPQ